MPEQMMRRQTPEEKAPSGDDDQARADRRNKLLALADTLIKKRDEAVLFRASSGIERRWREDEAAFDGIGNEPGSGNSMMDYASGEAPARGNSGPVRSKAKINVVRGKHEVAVGRLNDILFPTDERNWALKVTPVPNMVKALKDDRQPIDTTTGQPMVDKDGNPVKASDIARAQMDLAKDAMKGMETAIDDQLTECQYNAECRKVISFAAKVGTGIIKGPSVIKRTRKAWLPQEGGDWSVPTMQIVEENAPASKQIDHWKVFPAPGTGEDVRRSPYMLEAGELLPRELRDLVGMEGYLSDQIKLVLTEDPMRTSPYFNSDKKGMEIRRSTINRGAAYETWEYNGDVDVEDLMALGLDPAQMDTEGKSLSACVLFVNERPIKVQLHILDTGDNIYDFFQWTQVAGSPWGIGVVRMGIWWGAIIQAAWRSMLDNARDSAGANIVVGKGVEPADGKWEITGKKIWKIVGDFDDANKAFAQFQVGNNQAEMQALIEMALKFLDIETQIPMLFQGEKSKDLPDVLGIVDVVVDSSNVAIRSRVKIWDDQVTTPHLRRYYDWNMQYNERADIKGDFSVVARGASELLERDKQARALISSFKLRGTPEVDAEIDWGKATRKIFEALRLDVLKTPEEKKRDAEAKEGQEAPQDPRIATATIRAQSEMQKAQLNQQSDMSELQLKAQIAEADRQHELTMKQMEYQMRMMEFSQQTGLTLQQIKADLAKEASKQNLQRELTDKKIAAPQVAKPSVEPPQRAPAGRAFQE